jgi:molybdopterin-guanine dinucleotide biosynthesis protein A
LIQAFPSTSGGGKMVGALILAGGRGDRIGRKKALLSLGGRSLISYVIEAAFEFSDEIFVIVEKEEDIEGLGQLPNYVSAVSDVIPGRGPLMGMYSGLRYLRSEYSVILPCDSPFIKANVMRYLIERVQGFDAAVPIWTNGYVEPLHSVYRVKAALKAAKEALKEGELRMRDLEERLNNVMYVSTEDLKRFDPGLISFFNINSDADLRVAEDLLSEDKAQRKRDQ